MSISRLVKIDVDTGSARRNLDQLRSKLDELDKMFRNLMGGERNPDSRGFRSINDQLERYSGHLNNANRAALAASNNLTKQERATLQYDTAIRKLNRGLSQGKIDQATFNTAIERASRRFKEVTADIDRTDRGFKRHNNSVNGLSGSYRTLAGAIATVGSALAGNQIINTLDTYTDFQSRLKVTQQAGEALAETERGLIDIALETRTSIKDNSLLYLRLSEGVNRAKVSQEELFEIQTTLNKAISLGGSSAQEASGAIRQFTQMVGAGFITGFSQELNSISEQTPGLLNVIVDGMRETNQQFRDFEASGMIGSKALKQFSEKSLGDLDMLLTAISSQTDDVADRFENVNITVSRGLMNIGTALTVYMGKVDQSAGFTKAIGTAMDDMAKSMGNAAAETDFTKGVNSISLLAGAVGGAALAAGGFAAALGLAKAAQILFNLAANANPYVRLATVLASVAGALYAVRNNTIQLGESVATVSNYITAFFEEFSSGASTAAGVVSSYFEQFASDAAFVAGYISRSFGGMFDFILNVAKNHINNIIGIISTIGDVSVIIGRNMAKAFTSAFDSVLNIGRGFWESLKAIFDGDFSFAAFRASLKDQLVNPMIDAAIEIADAYDKNINTDYLGNIANDVVNTATSFADRVIANAESKYKLANSSLNSSTAESNKLSNAATTSTNEQNAALDKLKQGYIEQLTTLNMTNAELARYNMLKAGASVEDAEFYANLVRQNDAARDSISAFSESANAFDNWLNGVKDSLDPMRELQREAEKVLKALEMGELSPEEAAEHINKLKDSLKGLEKVKINPFEGIGKGMNEMASGINSIAGAMQGMYEEGSRGYQNMAIAMQAANVVAAVGAVLQQGMANPWTAFANMAAMAASVASLGYSVGSIGGGFTDDAAIRQAEQGTGTVLGDSDAKSESIANAVEVTADATRELVGINRGMLNALQAMQVGISGASVMVAQQMGRTSFDYGGGRTAIATPTNVFDKAADFTNNSFMSSNILTAVTGGLNLITGGLFKGVAKILGGKSKVTDEGVKIIGATLADMIEETTVKGYQVTKTKKNIASSTKTHEAAADLSDKMALQFNRVFSSLADSVYKGATTLGLAGDDVSDTINNFVIETQKISLKGLDAEKQAAAINAVFSVMFDNLAESTVDFLPDFQKAGEGLGETLARVATQVQVTEEAVFRLGFAAEQVTPEQFAHLADGLIKASGGIEEFIGGMARFIDKFAPEAHKLEIASSDMERALSAVGLSVPETSEAMWELMQSLDASTEEGQKQIATLLELTDTADGYYKMLESGTGSAAAEVQKLSEALKGFIRNAQNSTHSLKMQLLQLQGDTEGIRNAERARIRDALNAQVNPAKAQLSALKEQQAAAAEAGASKTAIERQLAEAKTHAKAFAADAQYARNVYSLGGKTVDILGVQYTADQFAESVDYWNQKIAEAEDALNALGADSGSGDFAGQIEKLQNEIKAAEKASNEQLAAQEAIWKEEDRQAAAARAKQRADERLGLEMQELRLIGDIAAIRELELKVIHESNRDVQLRIWALEDEAKEIERLNAVNSQKISIEQRIAELTENTVDAQKWLEESRKVELKGIDESLHERQRYLWSLEDEAKEIDTLTSKRQGLLDEIYAMLDAAYALLERSINAEKERLQEIFDNTEKAIKAEQELNQSRQDFVKEQIDSAKEAISELTKISDALGNTMKGLRIETLEMDKMRRDAAARQIAGAYTAFMATGQLPDVDQLGDALSAVQNPSTDLFGSFAEYAYEQAVIANQLAVMKGSADEQLSIEEQTLENLESQLEQLKTQKEALDNQLQLAKVQHEEAMLELDLHLTEAKKQVDAIKGVDQSIVSVEEALAYFNEVALAAADVQHALTLENMDEQTDLLTQIRDAIKAINIPTSQASSGGYSDMVPQTPSGGSTPGSSVAPQEPVARSFEERVADRLNPAAAAVLNRVNDNAGGKLENAWVAGGFIPAFANGGMHAGGLRLVGERGPELEVTGSARYYSANKTADMLKGSGGNDELTRQLIQEVRELKGMMRKEIDNTDRTQRILQKWDIQGQPESREEFV